MSDAYIAEKKKDLVTRKEFSKDKYIQGKANAFGLALKGYKPKENEAEDEKAKLKYFQTSGFDDAEIDFFQKHQAIVPSFDLNAKEPKRGICSRKPKNTNKINYNKKYNDLMTKNTDNIKEDWEKVIDYEMAKELKYPVALENKNLTEEEMITIIDHQFDYNAEDIIYNNDQVRTNQEYSIANDHYNQLDKDGKKIATAIYGSMSRYRAGLHQEIMYSSSEAMNKFVKKHPLNRPHVSFALSYDKGVAINYLNNLFGTNYTENDKLDSKTLLKNIQGKKGQIVEQKNYWLNTFLPSSIRATGDGKDFPKVKYYIASKMGSPALNTGCNPENKSIAENYNAEENADKLSFPVGSQFKVLGAKEEKDNTVAIYLSTLTVDEMKENK